MKTKNPKTKMKSGFLLMPFLALGLAALGTSCSGLAEITGIHMTNPDSINVYYGNFSYEGISVTVDYRDGSNSEIPLTVDMIPEVEQLKFFKMGKQEIEVVYRSRFKTIMPVEVQLNEFKDSYALIGDELIYDGEPHSVRLNQELPEGASISYPYGNVFTNAGVYEVVGVMSKNGYASKTLTTTLTIHQAVHNMEGVYFEDATLVYNGEMQTIEAQNVPEGVEVEYEIYDADRGIRINKVVNAGEYRVVAKFIDPSPNYADIEDMEAHLTILPAVYDLSGITLKDEVKEYDGTGYQAKITNEDALPKGWSVSYVYTDEEGNKVPAPVNVGTYTVTANFTADPSDVSVNNYQPIEPMTAKLTIAPRVIKISDKVTFESKTVNFDEEMTYSLTYSGELDEEKVTVTYENNDQHYAGEYEVVAHFEAKDPNEVVDVSEMKAFLVINRVRRSVMVYNDATEKYDKAFSAANIVIAEGAASITGIDTQVYQVVSLTFYDVVTNDQVLPSDFVNGVTYKYVVEFEYIDEQMNSSVILSQESDNFTYTGA